MKKLRNEKLIISIMIFAITLLFAGVATYSYFAAQITGTDTSTSVYFVTADRGITITFTGGEEQTLPNIYPREEAWLEKPITITSQAIDSDVKFLYTFNMEVDENTFHPDDLKYTFTKQTTTGVEEASITETTTLTNLESKVNIGSGTVPATNASTITYILKVYFVNDANRNQNTGSIQSAKFHVTYNWGTAVTLSVANLDGVTTNLSQSQQVVSGTTVKLPTATKAGEDFGGWEITSGEGSISNNVLTVQNGNVTISPKFGTSLVNYIKTLCGGDGANCNENSDGLYIDPTTDKNIRYQGNTPNNYISFNNETWRIIGIFNVKNAGTEEVVPKVKIVRNDEIGSFSWDVTNENGEETVYGSNDWTKAELMKELNGDYLNYNLTTNPTNWYNAYWTSDNSHLYDRTGVFNKDYTIKKDAQKYISETTWNIGGNTWDAPIQTPYALNTLSQYNRERQNITYNNSRPSTWDGKIGLIHISDLGYASDNLTCQANMRDGVIYEGNDVWDYSNATCGKDNNWLDKGSWYWSMSPYSGLSRNVLRVSSSGAVSEFDAYHSLGVRPALYLNSEVLLTGGTGADAANAYTIG